MPKNEKEPRDKSKKKKKSSWTKPERDLSKKEAKMLVAERLALLCKVVMNFQVYSFGGDIMLQEGHGCIGDKAITVIAALVMIWWVNNLKKKLEEVDIVPDLLEIYVDDVNTVIKPIEAGLHYVDGELVFNEEKAKADENVREDERTMKVVQQVANSIDGMIVMTIDVPSSHEDNKVPMLDIKAWMNESNEVYYEFYEKPTKNPLVISKKSAMGMKKKIDFLSQGVFRRLHNTKKEIEWKKKVKILEKFMTELKASGYSERDRAEILKSGVTRYENLLQTKKLSNIRKKGRKKFKERKLVCKEE